MKTMPRITLDTPLRAARKRLGLTQAELAKAVGTYPSQIHRYEIGGMKVGPAGKLVHFFKGELTYDDLSVSMRDLREATARSGAKTKRRRKLAA